MDIDWNRIERSSTTFTGIIPSREVHCTGKITLDVVFGTPDNYRSEEVTFQVAPFSSGYHALLGREAFTIFQARAPAALVLSPIVDDFRLTKVLMDGGIG